MWTDHDRKYENASDDKFAASATHKWVKEISANVFDDTKNDTSDNRPQNTVETTQNGNRQTLEKQQ